MSSVKLIKRVSKQKNLRNLRDSLKSAINKVDIDALEKISGLDQNNVNAELEFSAISGSQTTVMYVCYQYTASNHSSRTKLKEIFDYLITVGAYVNLTSSVRGFVLGEHSFPRTTPLIAATVKPDWELVNVLLSCGADPNGRDDKGRSPLEMALCYKWDTRDDTLRGQRQLLAMAPTSTPEEDFRIPTLLVHKGADPNILKDGKPLFMYALSSRNAFACKMLAKAGADLTYAADDGFTPLHSAAVWGDYTVVNALVEAGADITAKTEGMGQTPLEVYHAIPHLGTDIHTINELIRLLSHSFPGGSMTPTDDPKTPRKRAKPGKVEVPENGVGRKLAKRTRSARGRGEASTYPPITEDKRSISEPLPSELTRLQQLATQLLGPQFNLVPNSEDDEQERITRIRSLIRAEHFSSKVNYSLDSAADDLIHERKRSVCKVEWPGGSGSGFLIGKNKILTNNHIYEMMKEASKQPDGRSADPRNYRAIFVLSEHQPVVCHVAPKPPLSCGRDLDYAILELASQEGDNSISDVIPLGQFVSDNLEKDGMVVVVGHPGGGRKKIDFCPISGLDEKFIIHVLFGNPNVPREDIHRATYHTGVMFHGSSGSAGFDRNGNLVLMHTRGFFPIENQTSLIEEGVRLSSIREHARQNLAPEVFNEIFPQRLGGFSFGQ